MNTAAAVGTGWLLTYMSRRELIDEWGVTRDLVLLPPVLASTPSVRYVFVTEDVRQELCGPWDTPEHTIRYTRARAVVDAFTGGLRIAARYPPSRSAKAQLALLDPAHEEVWEFRSREPKPGVRVFGCFSELDTFIALWTELRENIDEDFKKEREECKRQWRKFFPTFAPHTGANLSDYITNYYPV